MPDRSEYLLVRSNEETGGDYVEMEWTFPPGAFAPPPHKHPTQVEEYEVLEGGLEVMIDGEWRALRAGESASVPPGINHTFRTLPGQSVRVRNFHRPGGRFDQFIARQHRFFRSDRYRGLKRPSTAIAMAMAWREHRDLLVPTNPFLRAAVVGLARIGRLLGFAAEPPHR